MTEEQKKFEAQKDDYLKNNDVKQMLWDTNQLLYWINENIKELNTNLNHLKTIENER